MNRVPVTSVHRVEADGIQVFYREAGDVAAPVVLLLHGFPTSSFMFRDLMGAPTQYKVVLKPIRPSEILHIIEQALAERQTRDD